MKEVAKRLNLKGHMHRQESGEEVEVYGPLDIEVHQGLDGRIYVVDAARLMPPTGDVDDDEGNCGTLSF